MSWGVLGYPGVSWGNQTDRPLSAPISAPINRSIRRLYSASSAELFMYTIVIHVNGVSYVGWMVKGEEFEETNFVKILQLP